MVIWQANRRSIYHSLQTGLVSRFGHGSQASLSYTLAKSIGEHRPVQLRQRPEHGTHLHRQHSARARPFARQQRSPARLHRQLRARPADLRGQGSASRSTSSATGRSRRSSRRPRATRSRSSSARRTGSTETPAWRAPATPATNGRTAPASLAAPSGASETQWLNPAAWSINGYNIGTNGTSGRNVCDGPGFFQWDAALYKNIKLTQRVKLQLRAEFFNVLNTVNFLGVGGSGQTTTWTPQNPVYNTGNAAHGDAGHQRGAGGRFRPTHPGGRSQNDTVRSPAELLIVRS